MKLLLFKVNGLVENLAFLPVVQQLRRMFPAAELTVFTGLESEVLFKGKGGAARVVAADRRAFLRAWANPLAFFNFWWEARRTQAEACLIGEDQGNVAYVLGQMVVPAVRVGAAGVRLRVPAGLSHRVLFPEGAKVARFEWELGRALAAAVGRFDWPMEPVAPELGQVAVARPRGVRPRVVVSTAVARAHGRWPEASWAVVAARLAADLAVVWLESAGAEPVALASGVQRVAAKEVGEWVAWLAEADLLVGNHGVGLQVAAALGCAAVVVAGPTDPEWDPVWHAERILILRAQGVECLPCDGHREVTVRCGNAAEPLACMKRWTVEEVEARCRAQLAAWPRRGEV